MRKYITPAILALLLTVGLVVPVWAQTTVDTTLLSNAENTTDTNIELASTSGISVGDLLYVDREAMGVLQIVGSTARVQRGVEGTASSAHAAGATVYTGGPGEFYRTEVSGACTAASEVALPHIAVPSGNIYDCLNGAWAPTAIAGLPTTGTGSRVLSNEPTFTRVYVRESFDQPHIVLEEDFTAKVLTDAGINVVLGSPSGVVEFREELGKTASSWVEADGTLDISADDTTDDEGVEIYLGDDDDATTGWIVAGTSGACFSVNALITDISGTDQFVIGWRQNEAFQDAAAYQGYSDWSVVGLTANDGSVFSQGEVAGGGTLSDDSGTNVADEQTITLQSCIDASGVPTAFLDGVAITMTNSGTAKTADEQHNPFISYLAAGTDGADIVINWWEISRLP